MCAILDNTAKRRQDWSPQRAEPPDASRNRVRSDSMDSLILIFLTALLMPRWPWPKLKTNAFSLGQVGQSNLLLSKESQKACRCYNVRVTGEFSFFQSRRIWHSKQRFEAVGGCASHCVSADCGGSGPWSSGSPFSFW